MARYTRSIKCPKCGNVYWDICDWKGKAYCGNCNYERPFSRRGTGDGITPSQEDAVERIRKFFATRLRDGDDFHEFTVELMDWGKVEVRVHTTDSFYTDYGGQFFIGRRGKIDIASVYSIRGHDEAAPHVARMLGAHIDQ
jgi:hypothetical protein